MQFFFFLQKAECVSAGAAPAGRFRGKHRSLRRMRLRHPRASPPPARAAPAAPAAPAGGAARGKGDNKQGPLTPHRHPTDTAATEPPAKKPGLYVFKRHQRFKEGERKRGKGKGKAEWKRVRKKRGKGERRKGKGKKTAPPVVSHPSRGGWALSRGRNPPARGAGPLHPIPPHPTPLHPIPPVPVPALPRLCRPEAPH